MTLTILADDLTGACDTGTLFAGPGPVPVTVWPSLPVDGGVRVVDTETRRASRDEAAARVRAAASAADRYFKKIDSTLRGHVGLELDALLGVLDAPGAVVCPAFPAQGRVVVDRTLLIDGVPLSETTLARDPEFPAGARGPSASNVIELLRPSLDRPLAWLPLDQLRASPAAVAARLRRLAGMVVVVDAETDGDLDALVAAVSALERPPLLAGSAGLARALATHLGLRGKPPALPSGRWLVVVGSRHPAARRQLEAARQAGIATLATSDIEEPDRARVAVELAKEAARRLGGEAFDLVVVTGGETAVALYRALRAERIDLVGAPAPGLALGYLRAPAYPALALLTKAGGFGDADLFVILGREAAA